MDTDVMDQPAAPAAPEPAPAPAVNPARTAWIVAAVATAVALLAVVVAVSAVVRDDDNRRFRPLGAPREFPRAIKRAAAQHRPVAGTISSIDGTSFKVRQSFPNGETDTTTVKTTRDTTFRRVGTGGIGELAVGETISVHGAEAEGVLTATRIVEAAKRGSIVKAGGSAVVIAGEHVARVGGRIAARAGMNIGEITKIEGDTITLTAFDGTTKTVKTTPDTVVHVNESITMKDLKKGDRVRVMGKVSDDKVEAHEIVKGDNEDDEDVEEAA